MTKKQTWIIFIKKINYITICWSIKYKEKLSGFQWKFLKYFVVLDVFFTLQKSFSTIVDVRFLLDYFFHSLEFYYFSTEMFSICSEFLTGEKYFSFNLLWESFVFDFFSIWVILGKFFFCNFKIIFRKKNFSKKSLFCLVIF